MVDLLYAQPFIDFLLLSHYKMFLQENCTFSAQFIIQRALMNNKDILGLIETMNCTNILMYIHIAFKSKGS